MFFLFKQKTAYERRISDWSSDVCSSDLFQTARPVHPAIHSGLAPPPRARPATPPKPPTRHNPRPCPPTGRAAGKARPKEHAPNAPRPRPWPKLSSRITAKQAIPRQVRLAPDIGGVANTDRTAFTHCLTHLHHYTQQTR